MVYNGQSCPLLLTSCQYYIFKNDTKFKTIYIVTPVFLTAVMLRTKTKIGICEIYKGIDASPQALGPPPCYKNRMGVIWEVIC